MHMLHVVHKAYTCFFQHVCKCWRGKFQCSFFIRYVRFDLASLELSIQYQWKLHVNLLFFKYKGGIFRSFNSLS